MKSQTCPVTRVTAELQEQYDRDPVGTLKMLAGQTQTEEGKAGFRRRIEQAEKDKMATERPPGQIGETPSPAVVNDRNLDRLADQLQRGRTPFEAVCSAISHAVGATLGFIWHLLRGALMATGTTVILVLRMIVILIISGSVFCHIAYCVKFGLDVQGFWITACLVAINAAFYVITMDRLEVPRWAKRIVPPLATLAVMAVVGVFTQWIVISPSCTKDLGGINFGVVVQKDGVHVCSITYPQGDSCDNRFVKDDPMLKAPKFFSQSVEWFSLDDTVFSYGDFTVNGKPVTVTVNASFLPIARVDDVLSEPLKNEGKYLEDMKGVLRGILNECVQNGIVDDRLFYRLVDERMRNGVFRMKPESVVAVSQTITTEVESPTQHSKPRTVQR